MVSSLRFPASDVREIVRYNRQLFERFVRKIRKLPKADVDRRRGIGHESLFATLVHILNVQEVWLVYIVRGRNSDPELQALFADPARKPNDWAGLDRYARRVWEGAEETVRGLSDRSLGRRVSVFWMPGRYTVRDAILQTTFEEAHHLGELIGALWQDDVRPPEMTWIDLRRRGARSRVRRNR